MKSGKLKLKLPSDYGVPWALELAALLFLIGAILIGGVLSFSESPANKELRKSVGITLAEQFFEQNKRKEGVFARKYEGAKVVECESPVAGVSTCAVKFEWNDAPEVVVNTRIAAPQDAKDFEIVLDKNSFVDFHTSLDLSAHEKSVVIAMLAPMLTEALEKATIDHRVLESRNKQAVVDSYRK
jgi:hypothetical protein